MNIAKLMRLAPYHNEQLWALMRPIKHKDGTVSTGMCYRLGTSPQEVWAAVIEEEVLGTGHTRETLKAQGWVAKKIKVEEIGR